MLRIIRGNIMREQLKKIIFKIENIYFLNVLRHGLVMLIPLILIGGTANALLNLPLAQYQTFLASPYFHWIRSLLSIVYAGTFGIFSLALVITTSLSFAMGKNETPDKTANFILIALLSYAVQLNFVSSDFKITDIGITGCFTALLVSILSCYMYDALRKQSIFQFSNQTTSMEGICANAIQGIFPGGIIVLFFASCTLLLHHIFGVSNINRLLSISLCNLFYNIKQPFWGGLLYTILLHTFWLLGFHGSHIMEPVAQTNFQIDTNAIFNKSFFDTFIVMGGCGTTICVLLALLLFFSKDRQGNIAKFALPTVIFNINEMLNFGLPIVLNPILAIPFLATPILCYCISYSACAIGFLPPVTHEVTWTTPVLFSGYYATGSINGTIVQLTCILLGIFIYLPFLHYHKRFQELRAKEQLDEIIKHLHQMEEDNEQPDFLSRSDRLGVTSRMLLQDLKIAIKEKELFLLFQPQVNENSLCLGAEALLRWNHPVYRFIYPPFIIYLAKAGGILPELETLLFDMAGESIQKIQKSYKGDFKISVNITAKSLLWDIETCIHNCLDTYHIPANRLWLEITEQDVISNSNQVIEKLNRLKSLGHTLLIDDFGMGHTSLIYLQSNYFNVVKLDGSLVKKMLNSDTNQKIISSIVKLGKELDIDVIAEYVENREQRNKLLELGCTHYQGYLFEKPLPLNQFIQFITKNTTISTQKKAN